MLNVEMFVPEIYVKKSRDFQLYCKLLELIANDAKYNADTITDIYDPYKCNNRMLELLCTLYNYQPRREISDHDLRLILVNYPFLIKHKGSRLGIEAAISLAVKLTGKKIDWSYSILTKDGEGNSKHSVYVNMSSDYDKNYLHEFLELVLPVGFTIEDGISTEEDASTEAVVEIVVDKDVQSSEDASDVASLADLDNATVITRVEVLKEE